MPVNFNDETQKRTTAWYSNRDLLIKSSDDDTANNINIALNRIFEKVVNLKKEKNSIK